MEQDVKQAQEAQPETAWGRVIRQRRTLDDALSSINGRTEESEKARLYICGQIEAMDWVIRYFE